MACEKLPNGPVLNVPSCWLSKRYPLEPVPNGYAIGLMDHVAGNFYNILKHSVVSAVCLYKVENTQTGEKQEAPNFYIRT
jgi:hypothetical protein